MRGRGNVVLGHAAARRRARAAICGAGRSESSRGTRSRAGRGPVPVIRLPGATRQGGRVHQAGARDDGRGGRRSNLHRARRDLPQRLCPPRSGERRARCGRRALRYRRREPRRGRQREWCGRADRAGAPARSAVAVHARRPCRVRARGAAGLRDTRDGQRSPRRFAARRRRAPTDDDQHRDDRVLLRPARQSAVPLAGARPLLPFTRQLHRRRRPAARGTAGAAYQARNARRLDARRPLAQRLRCHPRGGALRNPNYHSDDDLPETLDYGRMAQVVQGLHAAVVALFDAGSK